MKSRILLALGVTVLATTPALAGSHLWVINEVFSNADGSIQFIEMKECCGAANEIFIANKWVSSASTANQHFFTMNLPAGSTANQHLLLATQAFADLPGAPTPDHIIPENFFDHLGADTIQYWMYTASILDYGAGAVPIDGVNSYNQDDTIGINSPTNFAGETGSINVGMPPADPEFIRGDVNGDGTFNALVDVLFLLNFGFTPGSPAPTCDASADVDSDGVVNPLSDAIFALNYGFTPGSPPIEAPHPDCGADAGTPLECTEFVACP